MGIMGSFGAESPLIAGRYRLDFRLGRGGMGTVWRATDELLQRHVAVKEIHVGEGLPESDARSQRERTLREARTVAQVRHPSVVVVHDVVEEDERPWIVMELIVGRTLADRIAAEGSVPPREAARIGLALLGALREAHRHGVLHRDLKPANVLLEAPAGRVVLTDFGVARMDGGTTITESGTFVGSPEYTAPERMAGTGAGPESDLWSLGVLLCAALSGRTPFQQDSLGGVLHAVMAGDIRPPEAARPLLPAILGLLERDPARRMGAAEAEGLLTEYLRTGRMPEVPRFARAGGGRGGAVGGAGADAAAAAGYAGPPPDAVRPGGGHPGGPPLGPLLPPRWSRHRGRTALAAALMVAAAGGTGVAAVAMLVNGETPLDDRPTSTSRPDGTGDGEGSGSGGPTSPTATPSASRSSASPGPSGSGPSSSAPPGPSGAGPSGRGPSGSASSAAGPSVPGRLSGVDGASAPAPPAGGPAAGAPLPSAPASARSLPEVPVPPLTGRLPAAAGTGTAADGGGDGAPERLRADEEAAAGREREHPRAPW